MQGTSWYIGWDVGGWNCDKNGRSRDAIVILDGGLNIVGEPWRGNLRSHINEAMSSRDWLVCLFGLCHTAAPDETAHCLMAIDTPLGFSDAFIHLASDLKAADSIGTSNTNPYLFRRTEHVLFEQGLSPLSAIKDMIGSQATKGLHVLARFAPQIIECGLWSDGAGLSAIEAYPAACKTSARMAELLKPLPRLEPDDCQDALVCALVGYLFANERDALMAPEAGTSDREGWIWVPRDTFS